MLYQLSYTPTSDGLCTEFWPEKQFLIYLIGWFTYTAAMVTHVKLYNTLHREKEIFTPRTDGEVQVYTCGPTVYHDAHIGNMRAFMTADILKKTLKLAGYTVHHVMNITDVGHLTDDGDAGEDKMLVAMRREGKTAAEIAEFYTERFVTDAEVLNIDLPQGKDMPRATAYIPQQIEMVQQLEAKGYTYQTSDGVYFDTSKLKDYGKLAKLDLENLNAGERVSIGEKRNPTDFALWKLSPTNAKRDMEWDSPWGKGFPGWHIECSAMSRAIFGDVFDIHTGGIDHIPVHHTNEIAQSEVACGCEKHVNYWLHNEFVVLGQGAKMSKSSGNFLTVAGLQEKGFHPLALRYLYLQTHYRKSVKFDWDILADAQTALKRLWQRSAGVDFNTRNQTAQLSEVIQIALCDDLNTAEALAKLWDGLKQLEGAELATMLWQAEEVLSLGLANAQQMLDELAKLTAVDDVSAELQELLAQRQQARAAKDFAQADALRDKILAAGYKVVDTADGAKLERI